MTQLQKSLVAQLLFEVIHVCSVVANKLKEEGDNVRQCSEIESLQAEICSYTHFFLIEEPTVIHFCTKAQRPSFSKTFPIAEICSCSSFTSRSSLAQFISTLFKSKEERLLSFPLVSAIPIRIYLSTQGSNPSMPSSPLWMVTSKNYNCVVRVPQAGVH